MLWRPLQIVVVGLALSANVYWGITENGYVASITAGFVALALTWLILKAMDWRRYGFASLGMPPAARIAAVTAKTLLVLIAVFAIGLPYVMWVEPLILQ